MPLTVSDILMSADLFRRAYPNWTHAEPEEAPVTPAPKTGDRVRFPDGRTTLALSVSPDGSWFRAANGEAYFSSQVQVIPVSPLSGTAEATTEGKAA